jgi:50S ribosomal protein L16 3-hydroxylase
VSRKARDCTLQRLLGPLSRVEFERCIWHRQAWARPGAALEEAASFGWGALGELLETRPRPDVIVVARSQLLMNSAPRSLAGLRELMSGGIGICVRHAEQHHSALSAAAGGLAESFGTSVHVQVFVTPAETHGFGWHYDAEDVFIVQTAGSKDYYFRQNTVAWADPRGASFDFSMIRQERSPLQTARLLAGDCLYLPAGYWHMARSVEDSLSMSLGVYSDVPPRSP